MHKTAIVVIMMALAAGMAACTKCDLPDLTPKFCRSGPPPAR